MLMWTDPTGKQSTCPKPLSRKKLKQLMPRNSSRLTAKELYHRFGRMSPSMKRELENKKKRAEDMAEATRAGKVSLVDIAGAIDAEIAEAKPSIFKRLGGFFAGLKQKSDRAAARGK